MLDQAGDIEQPAQVDELHRGNSEFIGLGALLEKYVQWFLKGSDHGWQFPLGAIFLWHVAHRHVLMLELPDGIGLFLFRLPKEV